MVDYIMYFYIEYIVLVDYIMYYYIEYIVLVDYIMYYYVVHCRKDDGFVERESDEGVRVV